MGANCIALSYSVILWTHGVVAVTLWHIAYHEHIFVRIYKSNRIPKDSVIRVSVTVNVICKVSFILITTRATSISVSMIKETISSHHDHAMTYVESHLQSFTYTHTSITKMWNPRHFQKCEGGPPELIVKQASLEGLCSSTIGCDFDSNRAGLGLVLFRSSWHSQSTSTRRWKCIITQYSNEP